MNIKISSVHFDADKKLLDLVNSKIEKLNQFFDGIVGAEVILKIENAEDTENKVVEIKLLVPGNDLFSKKNSKSFEESLDLTVTAIKNQLVKHKEKIKGI